MRKTISTARLLRMKQIVRSPAVTRVESRTAASASVEPRSPVSSSSSGGCQNATVRGARGAPSRETTVTSSPVSARASSAGFATVADASRNVGVAPYMAHTRRSRRRTSAT